MQLEDFDYNLPQELIAQEPPASRDAARLLLLNRNDRTITERTFSAIADLLLPGDLLVLNDTRVIPARLIGCKESGGRVEVFLVRRHPGSGETWQCLIRSSKPPRAASLINLPEGMTARVVGRDENDSWTVEFAPEDRFEEWLERTGAMPLPPYIKRPAASEDRERYQTVFASNKGAVAAPTAGLHMTQELMQKISAKGVEIATVTLHVGLGTFMPVRVENVLEHKMHREYYHIPEATAEAIEKAKRNGSRVVALGTTTCRALEQAAMQTGTVPSGEGEADIFIYPGYRFKAVDVLITNFHLPKSTLLMLVSAFAGKEFLFSAYDEAIRRRFRFFSYGDAMMIT